MADHVAVGVVAAQDPVLAGVDGGNHGIGDFGGLHPRALLEGHHVAGDFLPGFAVELVGAVAVPEVGDVAELLGFGAGELGEASLAEPFAGGVLDGRRGDEEALGQLQVAVVLEHAGVGDLGSTHAVELVEAVLDEGAGDFDGAVATEVEEDDRITVFDGADGLAAVGNDELRQVLVNGAGVLVAQAVHGVGGVGKLRAFAQHVGLPAFFDHRPVGVVAVHGDVLAATAGGYAGIEAIDADLRQEGFEGHHVVEGAGLGHVAAVKQGVNAHGLDALGLGLHDHRLQVIDVAVHVAIGEQADEVNHATPGLGTRHDLLPRLALPDGTVGDGVGHQRGALGIHLSGADGVVADFRVAHVVVGGHAHRGAVGTQGDVRAFGKQTVEGRLAGGGDGAADVGLGNAVTVHDDDDNRARNAGKGGEFLQHDRFQKKEFGAGATGKTPTASGWPAIFLQIGAVVTARCDARSNRPRSAASTDNHPAIHVGRTSVRLGR